MSFLELSLYAYEKPARSAHRVMDFFQDEALSIAKRRAILKISLVVLASAAVGYMVVSGTIVNNNLKRAALAKEFETESRALDGVRQELIDGSSVITIDYLNAMGYKETKNLNILKRTNNVAGKDFYSYQ